MITLEIKQGTEEWFKARCGIPTASNFDSIITTKGEPSKQREKYLHQLVAERVTGRAVEGYKNLAMERGQELESEARSLYEIINDVTVKQVGIAYKDDSCKVGCSPDGLVSDDGCLEIKCPEAHTHVGYLLAGVLPTNYFQQVQGQLYVTGRSWVDFMSYYPGLKPLIVRVERNEEFIAKLNKEIALFCADLELITERIK